MISGARPGKKMCVCGMEGLPHYGITERRGKLACYLERNLRKHHAEDSVVRGRDGLGRGYLEVLGEPTKTEKSFV